MAIRVAAVGLGLGLGLASAGHAQCPSTASPYGINAHAPGGASLNPLLNEVQACGIGWIRIDFVWAWAEPAQDQFNWNLYDALAAAAEARGIRIFATIGYGAAWTTSGEPHTGPPNNPADWYDICFRAAQRYDGHHGQGRIEHWGMWNEPNLTQFWSGTRSQYINDILINGADAIHAANPSAKVCGPELAHLSSGKWNQWLTDAINQAGDRIDIVTHHAYSGSGPSSVTDKLEKPPLWPWDPPSVKQVLQNTGWFGKPFWLAETGWQSRDVGEANQASYYTGLLNDWFTGQPSRSWIHKVFFYELADGTAFPDLSWGILGQDPTYPRKPAFTAYQSFVAAHPPPPDAPGPAANPNPAHQATHVSPNVTLSWTADPCATSHGVYFGATSPGEFRGNQATTAFSPGPLAWNTTYYWRIDEANTTGTTTGPVWRFTTRPVPGDFDSDSDVDQGDFAHLQRCLSGNGTPYAAGCGSADFDGDGDVDANDIAQFRDCMAGPNQPPGC